MIIKVKTLVYEYGDVHVMSKWTNAQADLSLNFG